MKVSESVAPCSDSLRPSRAGFSLLELIVAIAIMVILVGVAVPVTTKVLTYKAKVATNEELQVLANAASDHFRDTWTLPTAALNLIVDSGTSGWSGPYLAGVVADTLSQSPGYLVDAWSRDYTFDVQGDELNIQSAGPDGDLGNADDQSITLNVTSIRRQETLDRLATINQAITQYNGQYLLTDPLSSSYGAAYVQLVAQGFLPNASAYQVDGWGDGFVGDPLGGTPLVRVVSIHVGQ